MHNLLKVSKKPGKCIINTKPIVENNDGKSATF